MKLYTKDSIAISSEDHKNPMGTRFDNSTNQEFLSLLSRLFNYKELRILDLGCSGGAFVKNAFDMGHEAHGLEGSDYSQKKGRAEWRTIPERLHTCDITKPFHFGGMNEDDWIRFEVITAWEVAEHIDEKDLNAFIQNIKDNLAKGGLAIISVANYPCKSEGVELHKIQKSKRWWIEFFANHGLYHMEEYIKYFRYEWVRGKFETRKEFHLILSLDPSTSPDIPEPSIPRKILNEIQYAWYGSPFYMIIEKVIKK